MFKYVIFFTLFVCNSFASNTIIVPFPAGGGTDLVARLIFKNSGYIIENVGGAGGDVGRDKSLRTNTALFTPNSFLITSHLGNVGYTPLKEFKPIVGVGAYPYLISAHPNFNMKSLNDLIKLSKQHGIINIGSAGTSGANHIIIYELARKIGFNVEPIPHRGTTDAILSTVSGNVPLMVSGIQGTSEMIKAGKLKPIAVSTSQRDINLKHVPTVQEIISKPFNYPGWFGVVVPNKFDSQKAKEIEKIVSDSLKKQEVVEQLNTLSVAVWNYIPDKFNKFLIEDDKQWKEAIQKMRLR